jgi:citronellyl-CoA dehydrogenase
MLFTADHDDIRRFLQKLIAGEINPHVDEWENAGIFPAHALFKKMVLCKMMGTLSASRGNN